MDFDFALFQQLMEQTPAEENNVSARFYDKAVKTNDVNARGLPIFKNVTYVEIRLKDNNTEVFNQPATKEKIKRFPREYALYRVAKKQTAEGTPLEQFAFLDVAEIATCKNRGIFTVEALAELKDDKVQSLGLQNEHKMAVLFLEKSQQNFSLSNFAQKEKKYCAKIAELKEKIALLEQTVAAKKVTRRKSANQEEKS